MSYYSSKRRGTVDYQKLSVVLLHYMRDYFLKHGYMPSTQEMSNYTEHSKYTIVKTLESMAADGVTHVGRTEAGTIIPRAYFVYGTRISFPACTKDQKEEKVC